MAEMNCGASGKDPGVTGQCCKKSCQGQIQVQASAQARPQVQTCCRPVCPPPAPGGGGCGFPGMYPPAGTACGIRPGTGQGCGMCPGMDPSRQALMKQINEASFAVDEAVLFLESGHGRIPEPVRPPAGGRCYREYLDLGDGKMALGRRILICGGMKNGFSTR